MRLFRWISMILRSRFVHCVPACISPVAVHAGSSIRARDEVCGLGQGTSEVDVGRFSMESRSLSAAGTVGVTASCYSHWIVRAWAATPPKVWIRQRARLMCLLPESAKPYAGEMSEPFQPLAWQWSIHHSRISIKHHTKCSRSPSPAWMRREASPLPL